MSVVQPSPEVHVSVVHPTQEVHLVYTLHRKYTPAVVHPPREVHVCCTTLHMKYTPVVHPSQEGHVSVHPLHKVQRVHHVCCTPFIVVYIYTLHIKNTSFVHPSQEAHLLHTLHSREARFCIIKCFTKSTTWQQPHCVDQDMAPLKRQAAKSGR